MRWTASWGILILSLVWILWDAKRITVIAAVLAIMSNQRASQSSALRTHVDNVTLIIVMVKIEHRALLVKFLKIVFFLWLLVKCALTTCVYVTVNVCALILWILIEIAMTDSMSTHWSIHEMGWLDCWLDLAKCLLGLWKRVLLWSSEICVLLMAKGLLSRHS